MANPSPGVFVAQVVDRGPSGEPDFADHRYWVVAADGSVGLAVNVAEVIDGTHALPDGHRIWVTVNRLARAALRHTFHARPPESPLAPHEPASE